MTLPTGKNSRSIRPAAGFTLLELVAVMAVVGVLLALVSPSLSGFFASRQTADAANSMLALTHYAATAAVAEGRPYRLNVDAEKGTYWLTVQQDGGDFVKISNDMGQQFTAPEGGKVSIRQPDPNTLPSSGQSGIKGSMGSQGGQGGQGSGGGLFGQSGSPGGFGALGQLGARANGAAPTYITFSPSRRSDPLTIELRGRDGEVYLLSCPSATEPFRVITPAEAN